MHYVMTDIKDASTVHEILLHAGLVDEDAIVESDIEDSGEGVFLAQLNDRAEAMLETHSVIEVPESVASIMTIRSNE